MNVKFIRYAYIWCGVMALAGLTACSSAAPSSSCRLEPGFSAIQVLSATDLLDMASIADTDKPIGESYSSELGGAVLTLHIDKEKGYLERIFQEPGDVAVRQRYQLDCISDLYLKGKTISGKAVRDGLILLEEHPNTEGIPNDIGILYKRD
ncbi:hypothetical protein PVT67_13205 [Gallaecimonas kandeliae]|uniref:hypothetical protein n=1 Tax=Gallaecimonas kandeliae TaxID=3029055 RepID=UPI0026495D85|nr:hypothetical protein [Gallaecimonas kandeliae]WKE64620.1 hypothetical protein PVT67_13205 [Gallaecimonas kandeliae]